MGRKRHNKADNPKQEQTFKPTQKNEKKQEKVEKVEVLNELPKEVEKKEKPVVKETPKVVEPTEEPTNLPEKKKCKTGTKIIGVFTLFIALVVIVAGVVLYVVNFASPKAIFTKGINQGFEILNRRVKYYDEYSYNYLEDAIVADADITLNANIEDELENIEDLKISGKMGLDYKNSKLQLEGTVEGDSEKLSAEIFNEGRKTFLKTNFYEDIINFTEYGDLYELIRDVRHYYEDELNLTNIKYEDYLYLSNKMRNAFIKSLDTKAMSKEKGKFEVLGEDIKGTKYTYTIDSKRASSMVKSMTGTLLDDEGFIKKVSEILDMDEDDVTDYLKDIQKSAKEIETDKFKVNIYTTGIFAEIKGIEIYEDKENYYGFYTDGENYELKFVTFGEEMKITAEKDGDEYKVVGDFDEDVKFTATVKEYTPEKFHVDYKIEDEYYDETWEGTIKIEVEKKNNKLKSEFKISFLYDDGGDEYSFETEGNINIDVVDKLDNKKPSKYIDIEDLDEKAFVESLKEIVEKDPQLKEIFGDLVKALEPYDPTEDNIMNLVDSYQLSFNVGIDGDDIKSITAEELPQDSIISFIVKGGFKDKPVSNKCISTYEYDKDRCIVVEDSEYWEYLDYEEIYTLDQVKEAAKKTFGRDLDMNNLNVKSYPNLPENIKCNNEAGYCLIEENGVNYLYSATKNWDNYYYIDEIKEVTNEGKVYTVVALEENEDFDEFEVELKFELLSDKELSEIEVSDVRFISLKVK